MTKRDYGSLVSHLNNNSLKLPREPLAPRHCPPYDPEWPTPTTYLDLQQTMSRLYDRAGIEALLAACLPPLERAADFLMIDVDDRIRYAFCIEEVPEDQHELEKVEEEYFMRVCKSHPEFFHLNFSDTLRALDLHASWQRDGYTKNQFMDGFRALPDNADYASDRLDELREIMIADLTLFFYTALNTPDWAYSCSDFLQACMCLSDILHGEFESSPHLLASKCVFLALHSTYSQLEEERISGPGFLDED